MSLISLRQLLDHAAEQSYGVPAFNVNNLEQIQAIMEAAQETGSPVILQASAGARKYAGEAYLRHMVQAAVETHPDIPIVLHQDHGATPSRLRAVAALGIHQRHDGWVAPRGCEDTRELRLQHRRDAPRLRDLACGGRVGRRQSSAAWDRSKPARPGKKTVWARRAS